METNSERAILLEKLKEGLTKAKQRRGDKIENLGQSTYEDGHYLVLNKGKTIEDVADSILKGKETERLRRIGMKRQKERAKRITKGILDRGYRLNYDLDPQRIFSLAFKRDHQTGETEVFFTTRSPKDPFSRKEAREALLYHIKDDTHKIIFQSPDQASESILKRIPELILQRIKTHSYEFPTKLVKTGKAILRRDENTANHTQMLHRVTAKLSPRSARSILRDCLKF